MHFLEVDFERDLRNELLNLPTRKILKQDAVPTVNLATDGGNPRKRQAAENRTAFSNKRTRKEMEAEQKEVVKDLLQDHSNKTKDAEVQVNSEGERVIPDSALFSNFLLHFLATRCLFHSSCMAN